MRHMIHMRETQQLVTFLGRARVDFQIFSLESHTFSYVLLTSHLEIVETTVCLEGFRHARAAAAAMCTLCHFLQGMVALAGAQTLLKQFEVSAKVALKAPLDRNVKKPLVLEGFSMRAGAEFQHFWMRK